MASAFASCVFTDVLDISPCVLHRVRPEPGTQGNALHTCCPLWPRSLGIWGCRPPPSHLLATPLSQRLQNSIAGFGCPGDPSTERPLPLLVSLPVSRVCGEESPSVLIGKPEVGIKQILVSTSWPGTHPSQGTWASSSTAALLPEFSHQEGEARAP